MRCITQFRTLIALIILLVGSTNIAIGQVSDSAKLFAAALVGRVIDTTGAAVAEAEVVITRASDSTVVGAGTSNKRGNVTLKHLPAGGPYTITARKIGYGAARGDVEFKAGDTLYVDFELPPLAVVLAPITVTARRNRLSITADQFNPKHYRDALSLLAQRRRDMLGDPEQCPLPDPIFGGPSRDGTTRIKIGRFTLGSAPSRKRPWLEFTNLNAWAPRLPYVQQLYVNGVRVDWRPVNGVQVPGRSVGEELLRIPLDQIAAIRYVDCWDTSVPPHMQYALYVDLKPPSRETQDSILRSILRQTPAPR